jgi:ribonucleoside-diphosphate reductase beta chain
MNHATFASTNRGLNRDSLPMRLWEKAKVAGIWNPADVDFTQDAKDWQTLSDREREILMRLTAQFQAGEEAVTSDLLPLIHVIAKQGRIEEEMYLTSFLWEEAKHIDLFSRFLKEVAGETESLEHYMTPSYVQLFYDLLPKALHALNDDDSPQALVRASATYNMVVEGMLAETGYHIYFSVLDDNDILPGTRQGVANTKRDESRHVAYGVFLLSRLMAQDPDLWTVFEQTMSELMPIGISIVSETFALYGDDVPFGLKESDFVDFATTQFQKRFNRIEKARGQSLAEIEAAEDLLLEEPVA